MRPAGAGSFWVPLAIVTAAAVVFSLLLAHQRAELTALREQEAALVARLQDLSTQNVQLRDERDRLLTDVAAIERVAREQYGFAAPGETFTALAHHREVAASPPPVAPDPWEAVLGTGEVPWLVPLGVMMVSAIVLAALERISAGRAARRPE